MFKEYIKPLLVLTGICLFFATAVALVHGVTEPVISQAAEERAQAAMRDIIPEADGFEPIDLSAMTAGSGTLTGSVIEAYRTTNDTGYIFIAGSRGYSGIITIICAIDNDGKIIDIKTLSHTETKGIGTIIEEESFLGTFRGAGSTLEGVDTVTGATISTSAFIGAVNDIFNVFEMVS